MAVLDWDQRSPGTVPDKRYGHALAYDAVRERIVMFGGLTTSVPVKTIKTYTWGGFDWTLETPSTQPTGRYGPGMAYDAVREVVVLFGGNTDGDETWEWDGSEWAEVFPATTMQKRFSHGQAYDVANSKVVIFGGSTALGGGGAADDETWTFDGTDWTQESPATVPPGRDLPQMVWDGTQIMLFGGVDGAGTSWMDDTWVWDGTDWTEVFPATPPDARSAAGIAYESGCGGNVILFGGGVSGSVPGTVADTWHWDGAEWTELFPATSPGYRANTAMAYDAARGEIILYGGLSGDIGVPQTDDTWAYRTCASEEPVASIRHTFGLGG